MIYAKELDEIEIGDKLIVDCRSEGQGFVMHTAQEITEDSVIIESGLDLYPNGDEHYIVAVED